MLRFPTLRRRGQGAKRLEAQLERLTAEQASEWVETMRKPGPLERRAFARWLKREERNASEYLLMEAVDTALHNVDPARSQDVAKLLATPIAEVVAFDPAPEARPARTFRRSPSHRSRWAIAAALAASFVGLTWLLRPGASGIQDVETMIGEQRVLELEDGSIAHVNARSHVRIAYSANGRDVELLAGEALFKVRRDAARPFRVQAGDATIRAVGTEFNVGRRDGGAIEVAVIEGQVAVTVKAEAERAETDADAVREPAREGGRAAMPPRGAAMLAAGESASIEAGTIEKRLLEDVTAAIAWRARRLVFDGHSLEQVAAEFNRYNHTPRLLVGGDAGGTPRNYSGAFDADDPESFVALLARERGLRVERQNGEIVIIVDGEGK
jgi:transmembrane sensor